MTLQIFNVDERCSKTVTFTLLDQDGAPVPLNDLASARLTLFDVDSYEPTDSPIVGILNNRDEQNILNANNVTIHATTGLVTWAMQPADNEIINPRKQVESHRAEFRFTTTGNAEVNRDYQFNVRNLRRAE